MTSNLLQGRGDEWYVVCANLGSWPSCLPTIVIDAVLGDASGAATALSLNYVLQAVVLGRRAIAGRPRPPHPMRGITTVAAHRNGEVLA